MGLCNDEYVDYLLPYYCKKLKIPFEDCNCQKLKKMKKNLNNYSRIVINLINFN
jgi:hypothetical protein